MRTGLKTSAASPKFRKLMVDAGLIVLVSFISPFRARTSHGPRQLCDEAASSWKSSSNTALIEVCEQRDVKGLYAKARRGEIKNFTGISSAYETPENPEISIDTAKLSAEQAAEMIVDYLDRQKRLTRA